MTTVQPDLSWRRRQLPLLAGGTAAVWALGDSGLLVRRNPAGWKVRADTRAARRWVACHDGLAEQTFETRHAAQRTLSALLTDDPIRPLPVPAVRATRRPGCWHTNDGHWEIQLRHGRYRTLPRSDDARQVTDTLGYTPAFSDVTTLRQIAWELSRLQDNTAPA